MKLHALALSVVSVLVASQVQANPKVYGQFNISAESYQKDNQDPASADEDFTRLQSNASRFGVRGENELSTNLAVVYGIEWSIDSSGDGTGGNADLQQRNRFVGIKHNNLGTVKAGRFDTYLKTAQGKTDLFNDFLGDIEFTIAGEDRANNAVAYESPSFKKFQFNILSQTQDVATKATNGSSASIVYDNQELGLYAALGVNDNIVGRSALFGNTREGDGYRLVLSYNFADLTVNGIYTTNEKYDGKDGEKAYLLGAAYKIDDFVLKAQYSTVEADDVNKIAAGNSIEKTVFNVGADYNLTSKTRAFVWYTNREDVKKDAVIVVPNDIEETSLALGVEHKF
ncbi:porin [Agitococcus lubricus]|uniref:Putative porin n=1 Tax=Agitococcus lubricus TaxID=1077255 RepID=A0A2T5J249_9GAMM|nr:porin [Agitococcus lubricus]PTQ90519.1 putative porin [Agitococcus lubricus]